MINILIKLVSIHLKIRKIKNQGEFFSLRYLEKELIQNNLLIAILSEIIRIQINKPLYIPALILLLSFKAISH